MYWQYALGTILTIANIFMAITDVQAAIDMATKLVSDNLFLLFVGGCLLFVLMKASYFCLEVGMSYRNYRKKHPHTSSSRRKPH